MTTSKRSPSTSVRQYRAAHPQELVGSMIRFALKAIQADGGRPTISGVDDGDDLKRRPLGFFADLKRSDLLDSVELDKLFADANPIYTGTVTFDDSRDHMNLREIAFEVLAAAFRFKEELERSQTEQACLSDDLASSLYVAAKLHGRLLAGSSAMFHRAVDRVKSQLHGKEGKQVQLAPLQGRNRKIRDAADGYRNKLIQDGKGSPSDSQTAQYLRQHLHADLIRGRKGGKLALSSLRKIISGRG